MSTAPVPTAPVSAAGPVAEPFTLPAPDGYPLGATRYRPAGPPRAHLVVAGATAVPQGFYRRFAEHAAAAGYAVLTLDYRGVGRSAPPGGPGALRGLRLDFRDWARLDLAAAVALARDDAARDGAPGAPRSLGIVAHSYGGHALGLLPAPGLVGAAYVFGTGAGWHGWMPPLERVRVLALWRVAGPLLTRRHGYLPWRRLGMGEDLPLDVYRQWRRWCGYPRYFFDDPEVAAEVAASFARVRFPVLAANATDDRWAPPRSRDAFMRAGFANAPWEGVDLDPRALGAGPVGHMGYFRPAHRRLWDGALAWLGARLA